MIHNLSLLTGQIFQMPDVDVNSAVNLTKQPELHFNKSKNIHIYCFSEADLDLEFGTETCILDR